MGTTPTPGVEPAYDEFAEAETGDVPHHGAHVVDVRVIEAAPVEDRGAHMIVTDQYAVGTQPVRIASRLRTRARLRVQLDTTGPNNVWIGPAGVTTGTGLRLDSANPFVVIESTADVWAVTDGTATVYTLAEVREG